jgi:hypothetical protein
MESLESLEAPYYCKFCNYTTTRKYNFSTHISSSKHQTNEFGNNCHPFSAIAHFTCPCGKTFGSRSGIWKHAQKCETLPKETIQTKKKKDKKKKNKKKEDDNDNEEEEEEVDAVVEQTMIQPMNNNEFIQYLLKENAEFKQFMLEQNKQMMQLANNAGNNNTTNHNHNHNHNHNNNNNNFNLHFYLNETCKNAMNIMDFVDQLQVGVPDLEETGRLGYAEGISKIFINGLKKIHVSDRPIHCSDQKRETLYIKNNDEWSKETHEKLILTNAIKHVAHKNIKQIAEWTKMHPQHTDSSTKENDRYLKIVSESMSGANEAECLQNYSKIIKNIVNETVIDKH